MYRIDTLVLIDLWTAEYLRGCNKGSYRQKYALLADAIQMLVENSTITDVVFSAYGSQAEKNTQCTDIIFKKESVLPYDKVVRHVCYDISEKPDLFLNKNVAIAGTSFYNCVRNRGVGISALIDSGLPAGVWSAPEIVAHNGEIKYGISDELLLSTSDDFMNDPHFEWSKHPSLRAGMYDMYKCRYRTPKRHADI